MRFKSFTPKMLPGCAIYATGAADALAHATLQYGRGASVTPGDDEAAAEQWRHERRAERWDRFNRAEGAKK